MYCVYLNGKQQCIYKDKTELTILELNQFLLSHNLSLGINNLSQLTRIELYTLDKKRINIIKQ